MHWRIPSLPAVPALLGILLLAAGCGGPEGRAEGILNEHVLFFSNFEKGVDALSCTGSPLAEIDGGRTHHHPDGGKTDGHVAFEKDAGPLSYAATGSFPYGRTAWEGGVSFWLSVDPQGDLEADYPEPFHIGKRDGSSFPWDDAVIFVDFTKPPRALRFGCYPDKAGEITDEMVSERVIRVDGVGWKAGEWHHIAITWRNFNSGKANAEWALFVDGKEKGRKKGLRQDVTWNMETQVMRFNHYKYSGRIDDIAVFDVMLTPNEAKYLANPRKPLNALLKKDR
ncbi:MAG: hypothetical protein QGI83_01715 [Candidatus Latescibacteria bacterium]|jgi:hypothetical protein|nr:hypothetical protein [Candidatus Latescibacterota bacterium]